MREGRRCARKSPGLAWAALLALVIAAACAGMESDQQIAAAAKASVACPSQDFSKFMQVFSESADVQRRFTSLPLEYGQLIDPGALDPSREYTPRKIETFEKIPLFVRQDGGIIFPSKSGRTKDRILMKEQTGKPESPEYPNQRRSPDDRVVVLFIENTGFHIYYRFAKSEGCWFLLAIHDFSAL